MSGDVFLRQFESGKFRGCSRRLHAAYLVFGEKSVHIGIRTERGVFVIALKNGVDGLPCTLHFAWILMECGDGVFQPELLQQCSAAAARKCYPFKRPHIAQSVVFVWHIGREKKRHSLCYLRGFSLCDKNAFALGAVVYLGLRVSVLAYAVILQVAPAHSCGSQQRLVRVLGYGVNGFVHVRTSFGLKFLHSKL